MSRFRCVRSFLISLNNSARYRLEGSYPRKFSNSVAPSSSGFSQKNRIGRKIPPVNKNSNISEVPSFTEEDLQFVKTLEVKVDSTEISDDLPDPPDIPRDIEARLVEDLPKSIKDEEELCFDGDDENLPPPPPKIVEHSSQLEAAGDEDSAITNSPEFIALMAAVNRACDISSMRRGPMPLHELANRSFKVQELVKLGVDLWTISNRHGDLERLLHLNWETQIRPHIRFLVDIGIKPEKLGWLLTCCPKLLWTSVDDMQVRLNYLEAKGFRDDMIKKILNEAPFWLSLSTRKLDYRLGFLQMSFVLSGSEVRQLAVNFPRVISSHKWNTIMTSTKLMERQFGFSQEERKIILLKNPSCYLHPNEVSLSFEYLHEEVGLPHSQLVKHAGLLGARIYTIKTRHKFLKYLRRDKFDPTEPGYVSPDWLWQGTEEEFCTVAAKRSLEDYELFVRHS